MRPGFVLVEKRAGADDGAKYIELEGVRLLRGGRAATGHEQTQAEYSLFHKVTEREKRREPKRESGAATTTL
ncbi:hypothetical protein GCM10027048_45580 [Hymenobacter coalescens]